MSNTINFETVFRIGADVFKQQLDKNNDGKVSIEEVQTSLAALFTNESGEINIQGLVENMKSADLMSIASSWLGSGQNSPISATNLITLLGKQKIAGFAKSLGLPEGVALAGLEAAVPAIVDRSSEDGNILNMVGGVSGALNLASKFFK